MLILGIETSCDETAMAVIDDSLKVYANVLYSQIKEHSKFGGVVPEIASRKHIEKIEIIFKEVLKKSNVEFKDIDIVGVTEGPGLIGSLLVGVNFAKGLCYSYKKTLYGIHHIEGHILSVMFDNQVEFPFISLVASGGHTSLFLVKEPGKYKLLGKTFDDAAGEAFDKVAKMLKLGYPGGPIIEKYAEKGENNIKFPIAFMEKGNLNFSFSGLKTSVLNFIKKNKDVSVEDICCSFQNNIAETFIFKINEAVKIYNIKNIAFSGGVSCNSFIKEKIKDFAIENNLNLYIPLPVYSSDNGAMIALSTFFKHKREKRNYPFDFKMNAMSRMKLCLED